jgi:hypothetical protein
MGRSNLKGLNIPLGAETTGLDKALADVNKRARDTQIELKQVERLLKLDPKNTELVAQKQKLLANSVEATRDKLKQLRAAQSQVEAQFKSGAIGDKQYRAFHREIASSEAQLRKLEGTGKLTSKSIVAGAKAMWDQFQVGIASVVAVGVVVFDLVKAAAAAEVSETRLKASVIAATGAWDANAEALNRAIGAGMRKAFDDELQMDALSRLIQMTGDQADAIKLLADAQDVSRGTGKDLVSTAVMLGKVYNGNTAAAKRFGIAIDKNATSQQVLAEIERRYAGQADAYAQTTAGRVERLSTSWDNLKEAAGSALASGGMVSSLDILSSKFQILSSGNLKLIGQEIILNDLHTVRAISDAEYARKIGLLASQVDSLSKSSSGAAQVRARSSRPTRPLLRPPQRKPLRLGKHRRWRSLPLRATSAP